MPITPLTGDSGVYFYIILAVVAAAAVFALFARRRK
ncbi:MAG: LPXTG cell wall anchor domain-containing protein [Eubacteriales bacterium]|jgi:LPXTG-motif cell wall-anchored protein